jgi:hypothetical protein
VKNETNQKEKLSLLSLLLIDALIIYISIKSSEIENYQIALISLGVLHLILYLFYVGKKIGSTMLNYKSIINAGLIIISVLVLCIGLVKNSEIIKNVSIIFVYSSIIISTFLKQSTKKKHNY